MDVADNGCNDRVNIIIIILFFFIFFVICDDVCNARYMLVFEYICVNVCQVSLVESCSFPVDVTGSRHKREGLNHRGTMLVFVQRPLSGGWLCRISCA